MQQAVRDAKAVIVIAPNMKDEDRHLTLQDFVIGAESVFPFFLDGQSFDEQIKGSGFERDGVEIDTAVLATILRGDEVFILNPGGDAPQKFRASDLIEAWAAAS
jgi:hypothetical protein